MYEYQSLYYPTNAHNVKNVELSKRIKIMEAAPLYTYVHRKHNILYGEQQTIDTNPLFELASIPRDLMHVP